MRRLSPLLVCVLVLVTSCGQSLPEGDADVTVTESGTTIQVAVSGGEVSGGGRARVPLGEEVTLVVTSDSADELHVHGYDLLLPLEPGTEGSLTFVADVPGVFEIELESSRLPLLALEVSG